MKRTYYLFGILILLCVFAVTYMFGCEDKSSQKEDLDTLEREYEETFDVKINRHGYPKECLHSVGNSHSAKTFW